MKIKITTLNIVLIKICSKTYIKIKIIIVIILKKFIIKKKKYKAILCNNLINKNQ